MSERRKPWLSIEDSWQRFYELALSQAPIDPISVEVMKGAFYAGASVVVAANRLASRPEISVDDGVELLTSLDAEVDAYRVECKDVADAARSHIAERQTERN